MPMLIWTVIIVAAVTLTVVLNRRKRRKFANLAAHMTQSGVENPSLSAMQKKNGVGLATSIQYTKPTVP